MNDFWGKSVFYFSAELVISKNHHFFSLLAILSWCLCIYT